MTLNADGTLSVQACNGAPSQAGWYMNADGTMRKSGVDNDCVDLLYDSTNWRDSVPMPKKAVMAVPCQAKVKFTFQ